MIRKSNKENRFSRNLQTGKAAEYLVCFDLIMQGYNAFLTDMGSYFDVIVEDKRGGLHRMQVKSTSKMSTHSGGAKTYKFSIRRGNSLRRIQDSEADFLAFVALDIKKIAYIKASKMKSQHGIKQTMEFKSRQCDYKVKLHPTGRKGWVGGKYLEDFQIFKIS